MSESLKIGIASVEEQRRRTLEIAAGTRRHQSHEPNVWFPSTEVAERVLSNEEHALTKEIKWQDREGSMR